MRVFRRSKFQRHLVIPLMLTCFLSGCYKWSAQRTPATLAEPPEHARITLDDGRVVELRSLEIRGDSVAGFAKEESSRTGQPVWGDTLQTYALADVTVFEVRQKDKGRTNALIGGLVVIAVVAGLAILIASDPCLIDTPFCEGF